MKRKVLQVLLNGKISMELKYYKRLMMEQEPEEIWNSAYEINAKIEIYELLVEMTPVMLEEQLQALLCFSGILDYLYEMWLTESDNHMSELRMCIVKYLAGTVPVLEERRRESEIIL